MEFVGLVAKNVTAASGLATCFTGSFPQNSDMETPVLIATSIALSVLLQAASSSSPLTPIGVWKTPVDDGLIRIERCGEAICGHVAGSPRLQNQPNQTDVLNHDPALRSRPILGLLMLKLNPKGPGHWGDGWIYNPKDGGTYTAKIEIVGEGRLRLTGCIAPFLCQTQVWTRES